MPTVNSADSFRQATSDLYARLASIERLAGNFFAEMDRCQCQSPFSVYKNRQQAQIFGILRRLTSVILSQLSDYPTEILPVSTRLRIEATVTKALEEINAVEAREWLDDSVSRLATQRPWAECQIMHGEYRSGSIRHMGTGNLAFGGGDSSSWYCGGPLRTDDEKELGMCGSCIRRYARLGIDYSVEKE